MTPGESTAALIHQLHDEGARHIVLLMRHSAREYEPGRHDLLNPLTDEGRELAHGLGARLPKGLSIKGYSSPAERCIETADLIMASHAEHGGEVSRNRVLEALGVFYVLDQPRMFMSMQEAGGLVPFLQRWYSGKVAPDILMPPSTTANIIARLCEHKLKTETSDAPRLDVLVSHDFTVYTLKDRLLGQDANRYPDVNYLDGVAFFQRDGRTYVQSHHEPAIELNAQLPD